MMIHQMLRLTLDMILHYLVIIVCMLSTEACLNTFTLMKSSSRSGSLSHPTLMMIGETDWWVQSSVVLFIMMEETMKEDIVSIQSAYLR